MNAGTGGGAGAAGQAVVLAKRGNFPEGLRVVVVDDDPLCLRVVERMLIRCSYIGAYARRARARARARARGGIQPSRRRAGPRSGDDARR